MNPKRIWEFVKESVSAWVDDYAPSMGAALAYYTLFSIAPLLVIVIAIAGIVFGAEAAQGAIVAQLDSLIGHEGAVAVQGLLKSASEPGQGVIATAIGAVTLIVGATTVFAELQSALDRIWEVPAAKKASGIWSLIRQRLLSLGMVLVLGLLMLVSLVLSAALAALGKWWGAFFDGWEVVLQVINFVVSFALITGLFAAIYKMMPRAKIAWHDVWIGAAVTALLFTAGKFLIGLYLGKSGVTSAFGAAGSMVVLLIWVYYSAQIFLLGAEFTWVYAHKRGSRGRSTEVPVSELVTERTADPTATPVESRLVSAFNAANVQWVDREIDGPHRLIEPPGRAAYIAGHSVRNLGIVVLCGLVTGTVLRRLVPPAQLVDRPTTAVRRRAGAPRPGLIRSWLRRSDRFRIAAGGR
jgi:membrane protein